VAHDQPHHYPGALNLQPKLEIRRPSSKFVNLPAYRDSPDKINVALVGLTVPGTSQNSINRQVLLESEPFAHHSLSQKQNQIEGHSLEKQRYRDLYDSSSSDEDDVDDMFPSPVRTVARDPQ
jgi:hypothetical protein